VNDDGAEVDWEIRKEGKNELRWHRILSGAKPLEFAILARRIPKRRYTEDAELQKVVTAASFFNIRFTLRAGVAKNRSYAVKRPQQAVESTPVNQRGDGRPGLRRALC